jgi:hypothetical protein
VGGPAGDLRRRTLGVRRRSRGDRSVRIRWMRRLRETSVQSRSDSRCGSHGFGERCYCCWCCGRGRGCYWCCGHGCGFHLLNGRCGRDCRCSRGCGPWWLNDRCGRGSHRFTRSCREVVENLRPVTSNQMKTRNRIHRRERFESPRPVAVAETTTLHAGRHPASPEVTLTARGSTARSPRSSTAHCVRMTATGRPLSVPQTSGSCNRARSEVGVTGRLPVVCRTERMRMRS